MLGTQQWPLNEFLKARGVSQLKTKLKNRANQTIKELNAMFAQKREAWLERPKELEESDLERFYYCGMNKGLCNKTGDFLHSLVLESKAAPKDEHLEKDTLAKFGELCEQKTKGALQRDSLDIINRKKRKTSIESDSDHGEVFKYILILDKFCIFSTKLKNFCGSILL